MPNGLLPLDLLDLVGLGAAGRVHLDGFALLLVDQRARDRRGDRNPPLLGVGLGLADDLPHLLLVGVLVDQRDGRAERNRVAGQFRHVDDVGARKLVLELGDAPFVQGLLLLGGVILGVLRQVAMRARIGDLLDDARPLDLLAMLELGFERGIAGRGHWNLVHRLYLLLAGARTNLSDFQRRQAPFTLNSMSHDSVQSTRNTTPATVSRATGVTSDERRPKKPVAASLT